MQSNCKQALSLSVNSDCPYSFSYNIKSYFRSLALIGSAPLQMVVICTQCLLSLLSLWAITSHLWQGNKLQGKPKYPVSAHKGWVLSLQVYTHTHTHTRIYKYHFIGASCTNIQSSKTCKIFPPLIRKRLNGQETGNSGCMCWCSLSLRLYEGFRPRVENYRFRITYWASKGVNVLCMHIKAHKNIHFFWIMFYFAFYFFGLISVWLILKLRRWSVTLLSWHVFKLFVGPQLWLRGNVCLWMHSLRVCVYFM